MPNTLSGGQKQRIAIARTLIKSPEIIMADEPTGALDSVTGKQVFDTLKKLSKDKLVIVVSHDREFAENYGDRIIELKDGEILSDISKVEETQEKLNSNISIIGDEILCISDGEELNEEDFKIIKKFLKQNKKAIICNDQKDVSSMKKAAKINDSGNKETFDTTNNESIELKKYKEEDSEFISSKLPLKHAMKIGVSGLKIKPFKLFLTIILCSFAFILFGLLTTMMNYNGDQVFQKTMNNSDLTTVKLEKKYLVEETYFSSGEESTHNIYSETKLSEEEFINLSKTYGPKTFGAVSYQTSISNTSINLNAISYYNTNIQAIGYLSETNPLRDRITGNYPTNTNEIVITNYLAESIVKSGLENPNTNKKYEISSINDLLDKIIVIDDKNYTIKGILECDPLPEKYDVLKENTSNDYKLFNEFTLELEENIYQIAFVTKEALNNIPITSEMVWNAFGSIGQLQVKDNSEYELTLHYGILSSSEHLFDIRYIDENNKTLDENEIILNYASLMNIMDNKINSLPYDVQNKWYGTSDVDSLSLKLNKLAYDNLDDPTKTLYENEIISFITANNLTTITLAAYNSDDQLTIDEFKKDFKIIGLYYENYYSTVILNDTTKEKVDEVISKALTEVGHHFYKTKTEYKADPKAIYDYVFLEYDKSEKSNENLVKYLNVKEDSLVKYELTNSLIAEIEAANYLVESLSEVFFYVGLVIALFAILLLSNFISTSINNKTKEIGVLRAIGARSIDVFKIFFSETFIIALICILISITGGIVVCSILNNSLVSVVNITLFVFGLPSIIMLILVAILTTIIATFIPVRKAANRKPVDSIRAI